MLLAQLFLAAGWARAGIEHAIDRGWWSGATLHDFLAAHAVDTVMIYEPFVAHVVEPLAAIVAMAVCLTELVVAALLVFNRRVVIALAVASFLNVHFMLAGAVNPSAFYLVITGVIVLWHVEHRIPVATRRTYARRTRRTAVATAVVLAPFVTTLHPALVIEDPAIVLIFLGGLLAAAMTWSAWDPGSESPRLSAT